MFILCIAVVLAGQVARADDKTQGMPPGMDMTKMGPMSRPVTKEDKSGVEQLCHTMEAAWKSADVNAVADKIDFPVIMLSDDQTGTEKHVELNREQFISLMKPFVMKPPPDLKMSSKLNTIFLSDTLAVVISDDSMTMGKVKGKWKGVNVVVKKGDGWKVKQMMEAGWGDTLRKPEARASR